jgi:integrase
VFSRTRRDGTIVHYISFMCAGKLVQENAGTDARAAKQLERQRKREVEAGSYRPGSISKLADQRPQLTVSKWFGEYHKHKAAKGLVTVGDMRGRFKNWIEPVIGALDMRAVGRSDLEKVVGKLDAAIGERVSDPEKGLAWTTAANVWGDVTAAFDEACASKNADLRVREDNPATTVRGPERGIERAKPILYPSEVATLLNNEKVPVYWRRVYAVAIYTGARSNELAALTLKDVDLEHCRIRISKQIDRRTGVTRLTKTQRVRNIDIEPELVPLLEWLIEDAKARGRERLLRMPPDEDRARLLRKHLRVAGCTREDLEADDAMRAPIVFHNLRDTCLTWMAVRGDDPLRIQWRAGHTDFKMTEHYIKEGRRLAPGFGTPFSGLPESLCHDADHDATGGRFVTDGNLALNQRPQRDLNPCYRRERPVS